MRKFILVSFVLGFCFVSSSQTPMRALVPKKAASGGITPPSFIQESEIAWDVTTTPRTTASINVNSGDVLVAYSIVESNGSTISIASSPTQTWTLQQEVNVGSNTRVRLWTAIASSTTAITVTFTSSNTLNFGADVLDFRGSAGVGASSSTNSTGGPSLALTTTANNSVIVCISGDWNAVDGASRTWRTVNSITPTSGNGLETSYYSNPGNTYTIYGAYYSNAGTAGSKTVGISAPVGQKYSIAAVEIKGQ